MKKTRFYNMHQLHSAKLVEFAGFLMPIQYNSITAEHKAVRSTAGVFDVSHMGEVFVTGPKAFDFVQYITINDVSKLVNGKVQYSAMCYPDGGIVDDLLVYKVNDEKYLLVINGSNVDKDFKWMTENNKFGATLKNASDDYNLLAVQGPTSTKIVEKLTGHPVNLEYYTFMDSKIDGHNIILARTGYTGEVGYEIYFEGDEKVAEHVWKRLFEVGEDFGLVPAGLAARDSLRLEMGFCLYGNDIDQTTNPLEAGLGWITKINKGDFIGKDSIVRIKTEGLKRKLLPLISDEKAFARHNYELSIDGNKVGYVTSGTMSPMLEKPIALAYIDAPYANVGETINVVIRNKEVPFKITKLPFVPNKNF
ncbi:MAG TPA: glycine cleavage system aminomethyltransferase GcvT [Ignavibacteriaceae bacterium]|nr:glycine cleavage system aminomethyltransferase GcvT [Ignavibacteriaceae bacterium]